MLRRYSFEATPDEGGSFVVLGDALEYAGREAHKERERIIALLLDDKRVQVWIPEAGDLYPVTANDLRKLFQA